MELLSWSWFVSEKNGADVDISSPAVDDVRGNSEPQFIGNIHRNKLCAKIAELITTIDKLPVGTVGEDTSQGSIKKFRLGKAGSWAPEGLRADGKAERTITLYYLPDSGTATLGVEPFGLVAQYDGGRDGGLDCVTKGNGAEIDEGTGDFLTSIVGGLTTAINECKKV